MNDPTRHPADPAPRRSHTTALPAHADHHSQHDDVGPEDGATQAGHAAVDQRHAAQHAEPRGHGGHENHAAPGDNTGHSGMEVTGPCGQFGRLSGSCCARMGGDRF